MTSGKRCVLLGLLAVAVASAASAQELVYTQDETMGVRVLPAARNRWRARTMVPERFVAEDSRECAKADFFTLEYGRPLAPFRMDLSEKGNSRIWGERYDERAGRAIRYGRGWEDHMYAKVRVRATVRQTGEGDADWTVFLHDRNGKRQLASFRTKSGENAIDCPAGMVVPFRTLVDGGIELTARGREGVSAEIEGFRIVPVRSTVTFRRTFSLANEPWRAGISFRCGAGGRLNVNGREIPGELIRPLRGIVRLDLTGILRQGENEVELEFDGNGGYDASPTTAVEIFSVAADGVCESVVSDEDWKVRAGDGTWRPVAFRGAFGIERMPNGYAYATGLLPLHAGALDPKPHGTSWPVFDERSGAVWDVALPPSVKKGEIEVEARDAFTGEKATMLRTAARTIRFPGLRPGAYRLAWRLLDGDRTLDEFENEMLVTGTLDPDEFGVDDVEPELRRRLRPVDDIDVTAERGADGFLDHSGAFGAAATNVGRVIERDGFRVRETGAGWLDLISYRIRCGDLGAPHVAEVDFPDTREQAIYACVSETYPFNFCNNMFPVGSRSWPDGTGAAFCGGVMPLSGRMKTLRFVFYPTSRNLTLTAENGRYGKPAGISRIRICRVEGGLPGLRLPPTERLYANHNERPLFFNWGCAANPYMFEYDLAYHDGMWAGCWQAIVNRIRFLRFVGHNASIEGGFMYDFSFPTTSGNSSSADASFDPLVPVLMMYRANGIRSYLSFEYTGTPALMRNGLRDTSDREVAAGKPTLSFVDRYGRQTFGNMSGGWMNFMAPETQASMDSLVGEMYARYEPLGVEGIVVQTDGCGWQPTFHGVTMGQDPDEVGYDDLTVSLFEREAGVDLGVDPGDPRRFGARHAAIHADSGLLARWREWRGRKLAETHGRLADIVHRKTKWRYLVSPNSGGDHGGFASGIEAKYPRALYPRGGAVELLPKFDYGRDWSVETSWGPFSDESRRMYREYDAAYIAPIGLDEHNFNRIPAAKCWWWRSLSCAVYEMRPAGENAFFDCAMVCRDYTPKSLFHTWLDVNCTTGHDEAGRRFLHGFYSTPCGEGIPYPEARGVTAQLYGGKLQLVNATPYGIDETGGGLHLGPFAVKVIDAPRPIAFGFGEDGRAAAVRLAGIMADPRVRESLSPAERERWDAATDDYGRLVLGLERVYLEKALNFERADAACANQCAFERMLRDEGVARVNCGCDKAFLDELGVKWLPDQKDTGFRAYGCRNTGWTSRGDIAIRKTDRPGVYRTEASHGGPFSYRFPVPDGTYEVVLHIADTYNKSDRGFKWEFGIGDDRRKVNVWEAAGGTGATATLHRFTDVRPVNGEITVDFTVSVVNGIEIICR